VNNIAYAQAVQEAAKPKFRGRDNLTSKVVTHHPANIEREYIRITNTYMTLLNKTLAEHLPTIRRAIADEREGMRRDDARSVMEIIARTFMRIQVEFQKKSEAFELERKLTALSNQTRRYSVRQWRRVVQQTLGIDIMESYYTGEFYRETLTLWTQTNVNLIKTIPQNTLTTMRNIVESGFTSGKTNTTIGLEIQEAYGIERRHAQFIARDQVAKLNADVTQSQQQDAGVDEYVWSTSGDKRVRDRHEELDGQRFSWSDPPIVDERTGRRAHPGQDYQCRCVALPIFNLPGLSLPWEKGVSE